MSLLFRTLQIQSDINIRMVILCYKCPVDGFLKNLSPRTPIINVFWQSFPNYIYIDIIIEILNNINYAEWKSPLKWDQ